VIAASLPTIRIEQLLMGVDQLTQFSQHFTPICLSLVSNAILYWNTIQINDIVENLRQQGEDIADETLSHLSLLPFRHVLPNGTYFIDDLDGDFAQKPTLMR
jgi:hypothetical protein